MKVFESKSSAIVTTITIGAVFAMILLLIALTLGLNNYGITPTIILSLAIILTILYFYFNSLDKIVLNDDFLVLKKKMGSEKIKLSDIKKIERLAFFRPHNDSGQQRIFWIYRWNYG